MKLSICWTNFFSYFFKDRRAGIKREFTGTVKCNDGGRDGLDDITSPKDYAAGVMERTTYLYRITKESREDQGV